MFSPTVRRFSMAILVALVFLSMVPGARATQAPQGGSAPAPAASGSAVTPQATPDILVNGSVDDIVVSGPRLAWHVPAYCPAAPPRLTGAAPLAASDPVQLWRL